MTSLAVAERWGTLVAYAQLGKLRLSALAVFAVLAGLYIGAPGPVEGRVVLAAVVGTFLVAVGSSSLNMYIERDHDRRMPRTQDRPLPTQRLSPTQVLVFGLVTSSLGLAWLWLETNALATVLCASILGTYVLVYTPLKRVTEFNTLVGAVPGALPPVVGYAAGSGRVDEQALVLFLILFFWQIPHFFAIAWRYREDYRLGGMKMLPVSDPEGGFTSRQMLVYTVALLATSVFAFMVDVSGLLYLIAAICLGVLFLVPVLMVAIFRVESAMRMCFIASILYLPALLGIMVLDKTP